MSDATLAEINPLVVTNEANLLAVDGKIVLDENGLIRHSELAKLRDSDLETFEETEARKHGLSYVALDGDIGCMVNGAGLAMATMDIIKLYGGEPANFLDVGGVANAETVAHGFKIILSDPNVKSILINIYPDLTHPISSYFKCKVKCYHLRINLSIKITALILLLSNII